MSTGAALTERSTEDQLARILEENDALQPASPASPQREAIARLAYAYWEERLKNNVAGSPEEDWYIAEQELA